MLSVPIALPKFNAIARIWSFRSSSLTIVVIVIIISQQQHQCQHVSLPCTSSCVRYMFFRSWRLGLLAMAVIPITAFINHFYARWMRANQVKVQTALAKANTVVFPLHPRLYHHSCPSSSSSIIIVIIIISHSPSAQTPFHAHIWPQVICCLAHQVAEEVIVSIRTMFSFAMERGEHRRYRRKIQEYYVLVVAQIFIQGVYYMVCNTFLINTCVQASLLA